MEKIKVLAILGKAGSGKDSLVEDLIKLEPLLFHKIISMTTRPKRDSEQEGKEYYFVQKTEFESREKKEEFLEKTEFNNWHYGSLKTEYLPRKINLAIVEPKGLLALKECSNLEVTAIYLEVNDKERLLRQLKREETPNCAEICRRYFSDKEDFSTLLIDSPDTLLVINQTEVDKMQILLKIIHKAKTVAVQNSNGLGRMS